MEEDKNKPDFINKRTEDLGKVFGMARQDLVLLIAVVSVFFNFYLGARLMNSSEARVSDIKEYMRTEGKPIIEQEVGKQLEPIKEDVKTTTGEIKQSITDFKEKMQ